MAGQDGNGVPAYCSRATPELWVSGPTDDGALAVSTELTLLCLLNIRASRPSGVPKEEMLRGNPCHPRGSRGVGPGNAGNNQGRRFSIQKGQGFGSRPNTSTAWACAAQVRDDEAAACLAPDSGNTRSLRHVRRSESTPAS